MNQDASKSSRQDRRDFLRQLLGFTTAGLALQAVAPPRSFAGTPNAEFTPAHPVRLHGAAGDGTTMDTRALQKAIDTCAEAGGGTVYFAPGQYLSGTLFLKSHVRLYLERGAVLLGSRNLDDYPVRVPRLRSYTDQYTERSLIYGEDLESVALEGGGRIDGRGEAFSGPYKRRPFLVRMIRCRDVSIRGLFFQDSPMWVQHYLACEDVCIEGITVRSECNANNDGLDIDGCQRVRIANCDLRSGDDALVLKSTLDRPCRNVVITNCLLSSHCNAFKLGTESNGGFENIVLNNCVLYNTRLAGLALECVDGGRLDGVNISNVRMHNVAGPIFIRLGNRARPFLEDAPPPGIGQLRGIQISDIQATGADRVGCSITGLPDHPVEDVTLSQIRLQFAGGGTTEDAGRTVEERPAAYPEYQMFGTLPAYGLFCRHVRNLRLHHLQLACETPDQRPSLLCDDIDDLDLFGWAPRTAAPDPPVIRFHNVRHALVHGCRTPPAALFLQVTGDQTRAIRLLANDLSRARRSIDLGPQIPRNTVTER